MASDALLVAAIDFGNTFSGCVFAFLSSIKEYPLKMHGYSSKPLIKRVLRTPTCILFDPSQTFHSSEAEDKYAELAIEEEHRNWYYFRRLKMQLYRNQDKSDELQLDDELGKKMTAMKVIADSITYFREQIMEQVLGSGLIPYDINWVLTIPAMCSDTTKQLMRKAAVKSGIPNSQLLLALEPDAALLYCKHVPPERMVNAGISLYETFCPGTKCLILDAGGETTNIAVHEVKRDGSLKTLFMTNCADYGGTKVEEAFEEFLQNIVGAQTFNRFRDEERQGHLELLREFEKKKHMIQPGETNKVTYRIPTALHDSYEAENHVGLREVLSETSIRWVADKLRVEPDSHFGFFSGICENITDLIQNILEKPNVKGTNTIIMVGGFSKSLVLCKAVGKAFPNHRIIIPQEAGHAVLIGALLFGLAATNALKHIEIGLQNKHVPNESTEGYPIDEIQHLGDKNRPHSIGNRFSDLFGDIWSSTDTLLKSEKSYRNDDGKRFEKTIDIIYHIIKVIDAICLKVSYEQLIKIVHGLTTSIENPMNSVKPQNKDIDDTISKAIQTKAEATAQEFRKSVASDIVPVLVEEILDNEVKGKLLRIPLSDELEACIHDCVELIWLMYIQQPSMELIWAKPGEVFNEEMFEFIGDTHEKRVKLTVWPAVLLYKDGDLVAKGYSVSI